MLTRPSLHCSPPTGFCSRRRHRVVQRIGNAPHVRELRSPFCWRNCRSRLAHAHRRIGSLDAILTDASNRILSTDLHTHAEKPSNGNGNGCVVFRLLSHHDLLTRMSSASSVLDGVCVSARGELHLPCRQATTIVIEEQRRKRKPRRHFSVLRRGCSGGESVTESCTRRLALRRKASLEYATHGPRPTLFSSSSTLTRSTRACRMRGRPPCDLYLQPGGCRFGANCRFAHSNVSPPHAVSSPSARSSTPRGRGRGGAMRGGPVNRQGPAFRPKQDLDDADLTAIASVAGSDSVAGGSGGWVDHRLLKAFLSSDSVARFATTYDMYRFLSALLASSRISVVWVRFTRWVLTLSTNADRGSV